MEKTIKGLPRYPIIRELIGNEVLVVGQPCGEYNCAVALDNSSEPDDNELVTNTICYSKFQGHCYYCYRQETCGAK